MNYWCSLWFWPLAQTDLPPERDEWLFDLSLSCWGPHGLNSEEGTSFPSSEARREAEQTELAW